MIRRKRWLARVNLSLVRTLNKHLLTASQAGQDFWIYGEAFNEKKFGYFLDIGAHDGFTGNNTYLLESDNLTGDWKLITYMKAFGEQGYFVNIPAKFISDDGKTAWLLYSGNFWDTINGEDNGVNPPGGHYGMTFQKIQFLDSTK